MDHNITHLAVLQLIPVGIFVLGATLFSRDFVPEVTGEALHVVWIDCHATLMAGRLKVNVNIEFVLVFW